MTDKTIDLDRRPEWKLRKQPICAGCWPRRKPTNAPCAFARTSWKARLAGAPAASWEEAAEKARYVLGRYAATLTAEDTRRRTLVAAWWRIWSNSPARSDPGTRRLLPMSCLSGPRRLAHLWSDVAPHLYEVSTSPAGASCWHTDRWQGSDQTQADVRFLGTNRTSRNIHCSSAISGKVDAALSNRFVSSLAEIYDFPS